MCLTCFRGRKGSWDRAGHGEDKKVGECVDPVPRARRGLGLRKEETQTGKLPPVLAGGWAASPPRMLCSRLLSLVLFPPLPGSFP